MNKGVVSKDEAGILYTYVNEIAFGWRSIESKRWMNIHSSNQMNIDFLRTFAGLTADPGPWQQVFNETSQKKKKFILKKILENKINLDI